MFQFVDECGVESKNIFGRHSNHVGIKRNIVSGKMNTILCIEWLSKQCDSKHREILHLELDATFNTRAPEGLTLLFRHGCCGLGALVSPIFDPV